MQYFLFLCEEKKKTTGEKQFQHGHPWQSAKGRWRAVPESSSLRTADDPRALERGASVPALTAQNPGPPLERESGRWRAPRGPASTGKGRATAVRGEQRLSTHAGGGGGAGRRPSFSVLGCFVFTWLLLANRRGGSFRLFPPFTAAQKG